MPNYTKLFSSIITSTIWTEDDKTRILWVTMLAMADQNGEVHASIPGLSRIAGMSLQDAEMAIAKLEGPDPYSRTPDFEGRRIAKIDGGWELLNHAKYRRMASREDSKEATANRVRRHRERTAKCNAPVTVCNAPVTLPLHIAEAEAEAEAENKQQTNIGGCDEMLERKNPKRYATHAEVAAYAKGQPMPISEDCIDAFFDRMEEIGWTDDKGLPLANWQARFRRYATNWTNNRNRQSK
jgi:hypothetical protein